MPTPTMKERPILFSGPMIRAILDGTKAQTRRIVKPQPEVVSFGFRWKGVEIGEKVFPLIHCPYGQPGDRLWVRESWGICDPAGFAYDYPGGIPKVCPRGYHASYPADDPSGIIGEVFKWRPSIHMPRWASRITLEVVSVRVERLQDISEEDAIEEGIERIRHVGPLRAFGWKDYSGGAGFFDPRKSYRTLWESINGPGSWNANPYVWVVEFKRIGLR